MFSRTARNYNSNWYVVQVNIDYRRLRKSLLIGRTGLNWNDNLMMIAAPP